MIKYVKGDIFNSPSKIIVNTVNTVGVMGKGVALEFKKRYPEMFDKYQELCSNQLLDVGKLYLWRESEKWVLLFPTKKHWRYPSKIEYIEKGLQKFEQNWDKLGTNTIAFPRLGCALLSVPSEAGFTVLAAPKRCLVSIIISQKHFWNC